MSDREKWMPGPATDHPGGSAIDHAVMTAPVDDYDDPEVQRETREYYEALGLPEDVPLDDDDGKITFSRITTKSILEAKRRFDEDMARGAAIRAQQRQQRLAREGRRESCRGHSDSIRGGMYSHQLGRRVDSRTEVRQAMKEQGLVHI